jgi:hypothetical protein
MPTAGYANTGLGRYWGSLVVTILLLTKLWFELILQGNLSIRIQKMVISEEVDHEGEYSPSNPWDQ